MYKPKKHLSFGSLVKLLEKHLEGLKDTRKSNRIQYTLSDVGLSAFACMYFQDPSLLSFQKRLQDKKNLSNFNTLFGVDRIPTDTQLRDVLDALASESLKPMFQKIFTHLQRGKYLEQFQSLKGKYRNFSISAGNDPGSGIYTCICAFRLIRTARFAISQAPEHLSCRCRQQVKPA